MAQLLSSTILEPKRVRWNFFSAWPSGYEAPSLDAKANDIAIDSITISCERLERAAA